MLMKILLLAFPLACGVAASATTGLPTTMKVLNVSSCYSSTYCPPRGRQVSGSSSSVFMHLGASGLGSSYWSSATGDSSPQWLTVEFGIPCRVTRANLWDDGGDCQTPESALPKEVMLQTLQDSVWIARTSLLTNTSSTRFDIPKLNFTAQVLRVWISDWYKIGCYSGRMGLRGIEFYLQACKEGEYLQGEECLPCPEGFACPGGVERFLPLDTALNSTRKPYNISLLGGHAGSASITVSFEELPTEIYDGWQLSYVADITSKLEDATPESNCSSHESWFRSRSTLAVTFSYHDFDDPCQLNLTVEENSIVRDGLLTVFLILARPGSEEPEPEQVIGQWAYPMQVVYDRELRVMQEVTRIWELVVQSPLPQVHPGAFESKIEFYRTHEFRSLKAALIYHDGEKAWIVHALTAETFPVTVKRVLLSRSADPDDSSAVVHDVSGSVQEIAHPPGGVNFSVQLKASPDSEEGCFIHIWSTIDDKRGRQLQSRFLLEDNSKQYAHQVHLLFVTPSMNENVIEDVPASEDVPLILPVQVAVPLAFTLSVLLGGLLHCIIHRSPHEVGRWTHDKKRTFFAVEFLDVCFNVLIFKLCQKEGDLQLEDNGWIARLLVISIAVSGTVFAVELAMAVVKPTWLDRHLPLLNTFHLTCEDTFQALLYGLVQLSQVSSNVDSSQVLQCASLQAVAFIIVKTGTLADPWGVSKGSMHVEYERAPQPTKLGAMAADD